MTDLVPASRGGGSTLTLDSGQEYWTERQIAGLRQLGVDRAAPGDLAVFMHVCQRTGLDPFAKQIYMIERQGKQTIQTGIDGFRLVARRAVDRAGETLGISAGEWCGSSGHWRDVWLSEEPPAAARVVVTRNGSEFVGLALYAEYVQRKRDGDPNSQWTQRPAHMLAKCAEALALRKAFPFDLSGLYTDDEMDHVQVVQPVQQQRGLAAALAAQTHDAAPPKTAADVHDGGAVPPSSSAPPSPYSSGAGVSGKDAVASAPAPEVQTPPRPDSGSEVQADVVVPHTDEQHADPAGEAKPASRAQQRMLFAQLKKVGIESDVDRHRFAAVVLGSAGSYADLTTDQVSRLIDEASMLSTPAEARAFLDAAEQDALVVDAEVVEP